MTKKAAKETEKQADNAFSFDKLDDIHEAIQDESSEPKQSAVDAAQAETVEQVKAAQGNTDSAGTVFDPKLHAVSGDGEPSITPSGKFRKRRGVSKVSMTNAGLQEQQQTAENKAAARAAGQLAADMLVGSAVTMLGDEWIPVGTSGDQEPIKFDEHANLRRAFGDYFEAKGIHDFPPGIALSIAMTSYIMPRVAAGPETKTKLAKAKIWLVEKFNSIKKGRENNATQPDSGNDRERKDDDSKATMHDEPRGGTRHART